MTGNPLMFAGLETGDGVLDNPNAVVNFSVWDDFFTCADQIEKTAKLDGQPAIWYIISDSLDIRLVPSAFNAAQLVQL